MALKRKEPSSHEKIGRKVKCVLLNEISQTEKSTMYTVKHQWLPGVWGQGVGMVVEGMSRWNTEGIWPVKIVQYHSDGYMSLCVHAKLLQSCPILCNPMDYIPPGSSVHQNSPGKNTGVGFHALLQGIFPTQRPNSRQVSCIGRWVMYLWHHLESVYIWHCTYLNIQKYNTKNEPLITMDFGWLRVTMGSSIVTNVPLQWEKLLTE